MIQVLENPQSRRDGLWALSIFLLTLGIFSIFAPLRVDLHHDGLMLKTALDVHSGQVLFRDTFTQYGALTVYIQVAALWILGPTLLSLKLATVFFYAITAALQYLTWRLILPRILAALGILFWLTLAPFYLPDWTMLPWSSVYALTFQSAGLLCFALFIRNRANTRKDWLLIFFCGAFAGLASWCRTPVGVLLVAAFGCGLITTAIARRKPWPELTKQFLLLYSGFGAIWALFLLPIILHRALALWRYQMFTFPATWMKGNGPVTFERVRSCMLGPPWHALSLVALLVAGVTLTSFFYERGKARGRRWYAPLWFAAWLITYILIVQNNPRITDGQVGIAGGFEIALLGAALFYLFKLVRSLRPGQPGHSIDESSLITLSLAIGAIASWPQYFPVPCFRHIYWGISPAIGPLIFVLYRLSKKHTAITTAVMLACLVPLLATRMPLLKQTLQIPYAEITGMPALKGMRTWPGDASWINAASSKLEAHFKLKGYSPILLEAPDAMFAAATQDLRNPGPLFVRWGFDRPEFIPQRTQFVQEKRPVIVFTEITPSTDEQVNHYVKSLNYVVLARVTGIIILVPVASP